MTGIKNSVIIERHRKPLWERWLIPILAALIIICLIVVILIREKAQVKRNLIREQIENKRLVMQVAEAEKRVEVLWAGVYMRLVEFESSRKSAIAASAILSILQDEIALPPEQRERAMQRLPTILTQVH